MFFANVFMVDVLLCCFKIILPFNLLTIQDSCSWSYDKTYDTQLSWDAPSCDIFNLGLSYFHVPLTTVRHLLNVMSKQTTAMALASSH